MYTDSTQNPVNNGRRALEFGHEYHSPQPTGSQPTLSIPLVPQSAGGSSNILRGRPYTKKTPSKVWLAYTKSEQGPICNYCGSIRKRKDSSTKTLWDHLDRKHYEVAMLLRRESQHQMPSTESSINSLIPPAFCAETNLNDMPYLYLSSFETRRHEEGLIKLEDMLERSNTTVASTHYEAFSPLTSRKTEQEDKCCITEMIENGTEETVGVRVMPSLVNQSDKEDTVSLVRWSLVLTALPPSHSNLFGVSVHGIRIDTGIDFASAEISQVVDGRTVTTSRETIKLVGPINTESVRKSKARCFEAGLPPDWRAIVVEQYIHGGKV